MSSIQTYQAHHRWIWQLAEVIIELICITTKNEMKSNSRNRINK